MAKVVQTPAKSMHYETDLYAWAAQQVELLRARRFDELDLDHLIEAVEGLGVNERRAVFSHVRRVIQHLLKLECSPAAWPRRGWRETILAQRSELEDVLTTSLRRELEGEWAGIYRRARRDAADDLAQDRVAERSLPRTCPYDLDQVLDRKWLPANRHGVEDEPNWDGA